MPEVNMKNARDPEQKRRMQLLIDQGLCYFCREGSVEEETTPNVLFEKTHWYVSKNNFPLKGSVHHYLVVIKRHITRAEKIRPREAEELFKVVEELAERLDLVGYSLFVRSGETTLTGGTLDHLHFHVLVGVPRPENATLEDVVPVVLAFQEKV